MCARMIRAAFIMFQPTHPHGVRLACLEDEVNECLFQPTHPHGVRQGFSRSYPSACPSFNPRTRTGCDA